LWRGRPASIPTHSISKKAKTAKQAVQEKERKSTGTEGNPGERFGWGKGPIPSA